MGQRLMAFGLVAALAVLPASLGRVAAAEEGRFSNAHLLVGPGWVQARLGDPALRVVDMRAGPAYAGGHVPGAIPLRVDEIRATVGGTPGQMPAVDVLEGRLGRAGIAREHTVVAYDDQGGLYATRLFLTLEYLGHERVHVLNGGWQAWVAAGGPVSGAAPGHPPTSYRARPRPELLATMAEVLAGLKDPRRALVDARSGPEFRGLEVRAARGGRIPGARHVEWLQNLRRGPAPVWKSPGELRALYGAAGATPDKEVVTYCQTHLRASHTYFTLRLLGYRSVKAYLGSWAEWGNDPTVPVE